MRFRFRHKKIQQLYATEVDARRYPPEVVDEFFAVMTIIKAAPDERDLYALKGLHFEKLKGERGKAGDRSLRLNKQWRLIVRLEQDAQGKLILILDIEKHYNE
mgnify:CR=1 FL=1